MARDFGSFLGDSASVEEITGPPKGMKGSAAGSDPVASSRCSQRMRWGAPALPLATGSTSTVLPSTMRAQPWTTVTLCFFSSAPTPVVSFLTMPSFQATLRARSSSGDWARMPSGESPA